VTVDWNDRWHARMRERHVAAVARGEHDDLCEYRVEGFYICHCSKRAREAAGFTEPPAGELHFPPPSCPRCDQDLDFDDSWVCSTCHVRWDRHGTDAEFTDDYGDLAADLARWEARRTKEQSA
jgi:hypothetical protein